MQHFLHDTLLSKGYVASGRASEKIKTRIPKVLQRLSIAQFEFVFYLFFHVKRGSLPFSKSPGHSNFFSPFEIDNFFFYFYFGIIQPRPLYHF